MTDIDEVADWYGKHFGFRRINSTSMDLDKAQDPEGSVFRIYGGKLQRVKVAFLTTGNGVGFEIFEFIDPPAKKHDPKTWSMDEQYQRGGYFHIALTVPDLDAKCEEVCKDRAVKLGETIDAFPGHKALYFKDREFLPNDPCLAHFVNQHYSNIIKTVC